MNTLGLFQRHSFTHRALACLLWVGGGLVSAPLLAEEQATGSPGQFTSAWSTDGISWTPTGDRLGAGVSPGLLVEDGTKLILYAMNPAFRSLGRQVFDGTSWGAAERVTVEAPADSASCRQPARFAACDPEVVLMSGESGPFYRMYYYESPTDCADAGEPKRNFVIASADSTDGLNFTRNCGAALVTYNIMDPAVLHLGTNQSGQDVWQMFGSFNSNTWDKLNMVSSISYDGGESFVFEKLVNLVAPPHTPAAGAYGMSPSVIPMTDVATKRSGYRMYTWIPPGNAIYSAFSTDGVTWTADLGVRISNGGNMAVAKLGDIYWMVYGVPSTPTISRAAAPKNLRVAADCSTQLTASWMPSEGASGYFVSLPGSGRIVDVGNSTNHSFDKLLGSATYNVSVYAYDERGRASPTVTAGLSGALEDAVPDLASLISTETAQENEVRSLNGELRNLNASARQLGSTIATYSEYVRTYTQLVSTYYYAALHYYYHSIYWWAHYVWYASVRQWAAASTSYQYFAVFSYYHRAYVQAYVASAQAAAAYASLRAKSQSQLSQVTQSIEAVTLKLQQAMRELEATTGQIARTQSCGAQ